MIRSAFALASIVLAASVVRQSVPLGAAYPLVAGALFAGALFVVVVTRDAHPFVRFGPANHVTVVRAGLVALVAAMVGSPAGERAAYAAVSIGLGATALDGVDGWLARRTGLASAFGARFDMETDAALILVLSTLAWSWDKAGPWIILSGLFRYLFISAGGLLPWMAAPLPPSRRRQTVCVVQVAALLVVLLPSVMPPLSTAIAAASLVTLAASFATDTVWLARQARPS